MFRRKWEKSETKNNKKIFPLLPNPFEIAMVYD